MGQEIKESEKYSKHTHQMGGQISIFYSIFKYSFKFQQQSSVVAAYQNEIKRTQ